MYVYCNGYLIPTYIPYKILRTLMYVYLTRYEHYKKNENNLYSLNITPNNSQHHSYYKNEYCKNKFTSISTDNN